MNLHITNLNMVKEILSGEYTTIYAHHLLHAYAKHSSARPTDEHTIYDSSAALDSPISKRSQLSNSPINLNYLLCLIDFALSSDYIQSIHVLNSEAELLAVNLNFAAR